MKRLSARSAARPPQGEHRPLGEPQAKGAGLRSFFSSSRGALVLLLVVVLIWSANWIVMKRMASLIGAFDLVAIRYFVAFLVVMPIAWLMGRKLDFPPFWPTAAGALMQMAAFQCLSQYALVSGGAGRVVMLAYTMPFWVGLFAWWLLNERITAKFVFALCLSGVGLLAIMAPWQGMGGLESSLYALAAGLCWGLGIVLTKRMMIRHRPDVLVLTAWQMLLASLFSLVPSLLVPQPAPVWGPALWIGLVYMSLVATAMGWWLWMMVVQRVSANVVGMSSLTVPMLVVLQAWFWLGERPTLLEWSGIVLIVAGLLATAWPSRRRN